MPLVYGVNFLGSKVSVCAMPPPIQSKITLSAVALILPDWQLNAPNIGTPEAMAARAAELVVCRKFLRDNDLFIITFTLDCQLMS
jgi:hypothetical protein